MKLQRLVFAIFCLCPSPSFAIRACISCNNEIRTGIYNSMFYPNLITMLSAFLALAVIVVILSRASHSRHLLRQQKGHLQLSPAPMVTASMVLGIGLGGFIDGIVLHQIFQWHEMLSAKIPATNYVGKSINMFWDGIFHLFCLIVVFIGIVLFWKLLFRKDIDRSGKLLVGGLLMGWALFNIVEGIIDHHLLKLHNVFEYTQNHFTANAIFLGLSVLLAVLGYAIIRSHRNSVNSQLH